ncbi:MAG TPA: leucyl/phenylalanyl-tRNA--protein transferase [Solirubrobacteraceae bacterium]|nr:leucyl/phenylalanyl-tRNA--protein transferase [Solirubrobacteraceae bacterium]
MSELPVAEIVARYAAGFFPMDDDPAAPEIPWYAADPRAVLELDAAARAGLHRRLRRSLNRAQPGWELRRDGAFEAVVAACAQPRVLGDGVWMTTRLRRQYTRLHAAGVAHTFELWVDGAPGAGIVAVLLGRVALLESMVHTVPDAGNVLLARTLDDLAGAGFTLCDIQLPTPHTLRLGARPLPRAVFEARLRAALHGG